MLTNLFAYGSLKTGSHHWLKYLAPFTGSQGGVDGFRLYRVDGSPAMMVAQPGDIVYGEVFRAITEELLRTIAGAVPGHYRMTQVQTLDGTMAWAVLLDRIPAGAVWGPMPDGTWRTRNITKGLYRLARERLVDLGDKPSPLARQAYALYVRDEIRPLAQANWVSIPWRTGPQKSEWDLCKEYMDRLAFAVEIGL